MAVRQIRNRARLPYVQGEGIYTKPLPSVKPTKKGVNWYTGLSPFERCHVHQTLASVRRYAHFQRFSGLIPEDDLDFVLASTYDHTTAIFPDPVDTIMQPETMDIRTWRRLRNSRDILPERSDKGSAGMFVVDGGATVERYNLSHPVLIGGITEREHPNHVKLMNSSHHAPQTNAGYCRQDAGGLFFQY